MSFLSKYPTVFTKKSKINMRICGYMLNLTRLVCPALQSRHLITQKYCCSFFPVKIEIIYESCTNIYLFQSHINFNILTHFLNANFEKSLYIDAGFALKKVFIDNQSQRTKLGIFFISLFFRPTDPSNVEKNLCSRKLNWSGLNGKTNDQTAQKNGV